MSSVSQSFSKSDRSRIDRIPARGAYDRETVFAIVDEAPICTLSFIQKDEPFVIPTIHVREGDRLYFHGATKSRLVGAMSSGQRLAICFTLLDGLVVARSVVHNSMNYRSVVAFGVGRLIENDDDKLRAFQLLSDKLLSGRWEDCKRPTQSEMDMTAVVEVDIEEASAKVREGPPVDVEGDYELPFWAGVLPLKTEYSAPIEDPRLDLGTPLPDYLSSKALRKI